MRTLPSALAAGSLALLLLSLVAFWPTYLSRPFASLEAYAHFHAIVGAIWLVLLLVQALFIKAHQFQLHRLAGRLSYLLAPLFALSSVVLAHSRFSRMDTATFEREAYTLFLPLAAALLFVAAFSLALVHRRSPRLHARFMACTALLLVDPVVGRFLAFYVVELPEFWHYQLITFGLECAMLAALYRTLPTRSPERRVFARFAATYAVVLVLWFFAPRTSAWVAWARWFRELPIT